MKQKNILLGLLLSVLFIGCTKYNQIDTGIAQKKFPGNMYEYFQSDSYNWDSLLLMIEYTGVKDYFTGEKPGYEEITFFGPTNHSIRREIFRETKPNTTTWVDEPIYKSVKEYVDANGVDFCKELILRHIVKGKYEVKDIPRGTGDDDASGIIFTSAFGSKFRVFSFREPFEKVPDAGAVVLYIRGGSGMSTSIDVASTDIEPTNGIVHSLAYGFTWGQL